MGLLPCHDCPVTLTNLRTPAVLIDKSRALANIDRMQSAANKHGVRLRPHSKTHKSPVVAGWQIARGAVGICCAKLGEAEVFADAGIADILLKEPPGLCIGKVTLADGSDTLGVLGEPLLCEGQREITSYRGWRAYIAARKEAHP